MLLLYKRTVKNALHLQRTSVLCAAYLDTTENEIMSSIGRTHHNKCKHAGCNKRRPYWADLCKMHRDGSAAQKIQQAIAAQRAKSVMQTEALHIARGIDAEPYMEFAGVDWTRKLSAFEAKYGVDVYDVLGAMEDAAPRQHDAGCDFWDDGIEAHCDCAHRAV